jgi:DNA-binding NtrC family response regulator
VTIGYGKKERVSSGARPWARLTDEEKKPRRPRLAVRSLDQDPFRILVATRFDEISRTVDDWADAQGHLAFSAAGAEQAVTLAREHRPEVIAVDILFEGNQGLAAGIDLLKEAPGAELAFVVERTDLPEIRAARDIGISRFIRADNLAHYLSTAIEPLARLARARRAHEEAQRAVQALPAWEDDPPVAALPLAVAERRFRESYLRASLAQGGGRRATAQLAGVPYTTLCVMLRKLGIKPRPDDLP